MCVDKLVVLQVPQCSEYIDAGAIALDGPNGDDSVLLTAQIVTSGDFPLDTTSVGVFTILFDVTDSAGNAAVTKKRFVQVVSEGNVCAPPPPPPPMPPSP